MKTRLIIACALSSLLALCAPAADEAASSSSAIDFGAFTPPGDGTFVEVKVNSGLIQMATRIAQESEPEMARILGGLKSIRVNVLGFTEETKEAIESKVQAVRKQLEKQHWERVVAVKEEKEDVAIYAKLNGEESIEGMAVTVISEQEAVLIHVDGSIRPEDLALVGKRLNIQPLEHLGEQMGAER